MKLSPRANQRTFYIAGSVAVGAGVVDYYGRTYIVEKSGALRKIKDVPAGRKKRLRAAR